jgi:uncharacterized membrane protein
MVLLMKTIEQVRRPLISKIAVAAAFTAVYLLATTGAHAWNFTVPATDVQPTNGIFQFPVSQFEDGKARHFTYKHAPNQWVRFFIVKSTDGQIRAAFDACEVCNRSKKGYVQQGDTMVCINCGMKFRTDKINVVTGGCNPIALKKSADGNAITITQQDVLSGSKFFQ